MSSHDLFKQKYIQNGFFMQIKKLLWFWLPKEGKKLLMEEYNLCFFYLRKLFE